jgi:hypothetical protein
MSLRRNKPWFDLLSPLALVLVDASFAMAHQSAQAYRIALRRRSRRGRGGGTLRPGGETPLWNELRRQLKPHLTQYGQQAMLGRLLGLPRQRVNAFVTGGGQMPDAERTLQLLAWLMAVRRGRSKLIGQHVTH